jgi:hypothetical protein
MEARHDTVLTKHMRSFLLGVLASSSDTCEGEKRRACSIWHLKAMATTRNWVSSCAAKLDRSFHSLYSDNTLSDICWHLRWMGHTWSSLNKGPDLKSCC